MNIRNARVSVLKACRQPCCFYQLVAKLTLVKVAHSLAEQIFNAEHHVRHLFDAQFFSFSRRTSWTCSTVTCCVFQKTTRWNITSTTACPGLRCFTVLFLLLLLSLLKPLFLSPKSLKCLQLFDIVFVISFQLSYIAEDENGKIVGYVLAKMWVYIKFL